MEKGDGDGPVTLRRIADFHPIPLPRGYADSYADSYALHPRLVIGLFSHCRRPLPLAPLAPPLIEYPLRSDVSDPDEPRRV